MLLERNRFSVISFSLYNRIIIIIIYNTLFRNPFEGSRDFYPRHWGFSELCSVFPASMSSSHTIQRLSSFTWGLQADQSDFSLWPQMASFRWHGMWYSLTVGSLLCSLTCFSYWLSPKWSVAHCPADVGCNTSWIIFFQRKKNAAAVNRHPIARTWKGKQSCRRLDCPSVVL